MGIPLRGDGALSELPISPVGAEERWLGDVACRTPEAAFTVAPAVERLRTTVGDRNAAAAKLSAGEEIAGVAIPAEFITEAA